MSIICSDFCRHGKYGGILAEIVLGVNRCNDSSPDCKCTSNQKYARKKTDTYDALRIAVAHRDGRLKPFVCCTREQYALRKALRDAQKEQQEVTKYANQMRSLEHLSNAPKWVKKLGKSNYGRILLSEIPSWTSQEDVLCAVTTAHPKWTLLKCTPIADALWSWSQQLVQLGLWNLYLN